MRKRMELDTRGVPVELMVFDDEGHGIVKLRNKLAAYPAIVSFWTGTSAGYLAKAANEPRNPRISRMI